MNLQTDKGVTAPAGFEAGTAYCKLKKSGPDLAIVAGDGECTAAGVFTTNLVKAAPVLLDQETLAASAGAMRAVVANSGNANACTGPAGMEAARAMQEATAAALGCRPEQVLVLSTGVIGQQLPVERVVAGIGQAAEALAGENGLAAAQAIMTTDTRVKQAAVEVELPGGTVTIGGMAKGSGMIHPNMATMLGVLTTDAVLPAPQLQALLQQTADRSFNAISVDGDTSTNDTVLLFASGASGVAVEGEEAEAIFGQALLAVSTYLAQEIVRDGEGASRFVTIHVEGLESDAAARAVAGTVATSPLVKTALAGGDANWGRILAAAGRAGETFDPAESNLWIAATGLSPLQLVAGGTPTAYEEREAAARFAESEIEIHLKLGSGAGSATFWTCDLTHEYITINADYRT